MKVEPRQNNIRPPENGNPMDQGPKQMNDYGTRYPLRGKFIEQIHMSKATKNVRLRAEEKPSRVKYLRHVDMGNVCLYT
jgi:hypothetical protein